MSSNPLMDFGASIFENLGLIKRTPAPSNKDIWGNEKPKPFTPLATPPKVSSIATAPSNSLELQMLEAQIQSLRAQNAARPKLPVLNTADMRAKAQSKALASVNPVYQDKLNNQLERFALQRTQQTTETAFGKEAEDKNLEYTKEDIERNRGRTAEDVAAAIDKSLYNEGQFQETEGDEFDIVNRQAREALAESGLSESGLGQQGLETMVEDRNRASTNQLKDFTDERANQELFKTRTFEDLGTKETRSIELNETNKANLDRSLNDYIAMQEQDIRDFRLDNEAERQGALWEATNNVYDTDIQQWLAGLKASGWRDQDIALAAQVYG